MLDNLSILYLRCGDRLEPGKCVRLRSFNSLFEMPVSALAVPDVIFSYLSILYLRCSYTRRILSTHSLTELSILYLRCVYVGVDLRDEEATRLSILYLRCTEGPTATDTPALILSILYLRCCASQRDHPQSRRGEPFNSLFEMLAQR